MTDVPLRSDLPLDLHPAGLDGLRATLEVDNTPGREVLAAGREALASVYSLMGTANDALTDLAALDPAVRGSKPPASLLRMVNGRVTTTSSSGEAAFAEAFGSAAQGVFATLDRRAAEVNRIAGVLEAQVEAALTPKSKGEPETIAMMSEVRTVVRSMSTGQRASFVTEAINSGDLVSLNAILTAPPALTGLSAEAIGSFRAAAAAKLAPTFSAQLDAARKVAARIEAAGQTVMKRVIEARKKAEHSPAAKSGASLAKLSKFGK